MKVSLMNQGEKGSHDSLQKKDSQESYNNTQSNAQNSEKELRGSNSIEALLRKNIKAKKSLANELSDMGLSNDEIIRILHLKN